MNREQIDEAIARKRAELEITGSYLPADVPYIPAEVKAMNEYIERRLSEGLRKYGDAQEYRLLYGEWPQWFVDHCNERGYSIPPW